MKDDLEFPTYWTKVQGLDIHYKCLGKGAPVILIHGGANDWHEWRKNIAFLARSFRVYSPDLPGFGLSQSPSIPVSLSWAVSFLKDFMDTLGIRAAHLIGHSLGGMVTIAFTLDFPERVSKLVLTDSAGLGEISQKGWLRLFLITSIKRLIRKGKSPKYETGSKENWAFINRLGELKCPVLIAWGEKDPYLPISQAKLAYSLIPDSLLYIFPRCRHAPQKERSAEFNNLLHAFLTE